MPRYKFLPLYVEGSELTQALLRLLQLYRWYLMKNNLPALACLADLPLIRRIMGFMELLERSQGSIYENRAEMLIKKDGRYYIRFKMGERQGRPIWTKPYPLGRLWKDAGEILFLES